MTHLGTYERGSDWTWTLTLDDEDGSAVNLKSPSTATVTVSASRRGAVYWNDETIATVDSGATGNPPVVAVTAALSTKLPPGKYDLTIKSNQSGTIRRWRHTFAIASDPSV